MKVHLITHTHWDREWYRTYQEFRIYLVPLIDDLLDRLETDIEYDSFLLDGQTVLLEDYLQIRPENVGRLRKQIQAGRLVIGPMYIQPDEYLPSGESLVRNFLIARRVAERFGPMMNIGYFPDSFGQASQIPQILQGFGIETVVFWRGLCDEDTTKTELIWEARDGSRVLAIWLPFSYGNGYVMSSEPRKAAAFIHQAIDILGPMATTENIVLMRGWDHSGFSPELPELINSTKKYLGEGIELIHSNLQNLIADIQAEKPALEILQGEFRKAKTMRIHPGIDSTRMDLKQANRQVETRLEKYTEPLCAMDWLWGTNYPGAIINQSWKYLLQSQAHDSICSCCTDNALRAVKGRFSDSLEIANSLARNACASLASKIQTDNQEGLPVLVFNPYPFVRDEIVEATALIPYEVFHLETTSGEKASCQLISKEKINLGLDQSMAAVTLAGRSSKKDLLQSVGARPDEPDVYYNQSGYVAISPRAKGIEVNRVSFRFPASLMPAAGYRVYYVREGETAPPANPDLIANDRTMENQFLRVTIHPDGTLDLLHKQTGYLYKKLLLFEDTGDAGDEYNYSPPVEDERVTSEGRKADVLPFHNGPLYASFKININMPIPHGLVKNNHSRSKRRGKLLISSVVSLSAGSKYLAIHTTIINETDDHRVRVLFPFGTKTACSFAEEQFGVIRRPNHPPAMDYWQEDGWVEKPLPIYPQQSFVDLNDGQRGLALLNRNLTEYEIVGENESIIALTLFRGVGAMGRADLVVRPGRASGLEVPTPDALCHGKLEFEYAIFPHSGDHSEAAFQASLYNTPMKVEQTDRHHGNYAPEKSFIRIKPTGLVITCLKKAEWDEALILRLYNSTSQSIETGHILLGEEISKVLVVDLKEDIIEGIELLRDGPSWRLPPVRSDQILTLKLIPAALAY